MKSKRGVVLLMGDLCPEWLEIYKKSGLNFLGLHTIVAECNNDDYIKWARSEETQELISKFEEMGVTVEHELHNAYSLLPRSLFDTRPELFREANGTRTNDYNYCVSNPEAQKIIEDEAYKFAKALGQRSHNYHFWADDKAGAWCDCEKCRGKSCGEQTFLFSEAVLRGIRRYDESASECYLAYQDMKADGSRKNDGLFLEFAPIHRVLNKPLASEENRSDYELLLDQRKHFDRLYALDYWLDESLMARWNRNNITKLPDLSEVIAADVKLYDSLGAEAITTFGAYLDKNYFERFGTEEVVKYCKVLAES